MSFALPQVGSVITVSTYYKSNVIGRTVEDDTTTYEKVQVIKPFGWTKPNAFCIPAEGEPFIKVRTISLKAITDLVIHEGDVEAAGIVDGFGVECTCLGYTYRKQCKHLNIASDEAA